MSDVTGARLCLAADLRAAGRRADPGRARPPDRPVQLLSRPAQPARHPARPPRRPGGHPEDRVAGPRLAHRPPRDGRPGGLSVVRRLPAGVPQAGPPPVVAGTGADPAVRPGAARSGAGQEPVPGHRDLAARRGDPRLRRGCRHRDHRADPHHRLPPGLDHAQRPRARRTRLQPECRRQAARRRPYRRRLHRVPVGAHSPPGAARARQRPGKHGLLRQRGLVHLGGRGDRHPARHAAGIPAHPAAVLAGDHRRRGPPVPGDAPVRPGRASRRHPF